MSINLNNELNLEIAVSLKQSEWEKVQSELVAFTEKVKSDFERVSEITWGEFKEYSHATSQDVSKTWGKTTKDMKGIAAESLWGTVTAWFDDDMERDKTIRPRENPRTLSLKMAA